MLKKSVLRRRDTYAFVLLMIAVLSCFPSVASLSMNSTISSSGVINYGDILTRPLHVEGRWIKDSSGNIILLRGVNYGGYNNDPNGLWSSQGGTMNEHFAAMQSWGINFIRYTLTTQWWTEDTSGYRQNIRDSIVAAQDYGIYILLCPWRVSSTGGFGSPFDMTHDQFMAFWDSVMSELGDLPNILIDPWNEPTSAGSYGQNDWQDWVQELINNIRGAGYNHLILYQWGYGTGPNKLLMDWFNQYPVSGTNVVISTHLYGPSQGYSYASDYDTLKTQMTTAQINEIATILNMPLLVGECGATSSEDTFFTNLLTILNEWTLGYAVWIWSTGQSLSIRVGTSFNPTAIGQILIDSIALAPPP